MTVRKEYVDSRYGQLHIHISRPAAPTKRPLLCFHLSPGSGQMWVPLMEELSDRIVVAPDTPGFGGSDAPPAPPSIEDYASVMADLVTTLGIAPVDAMGYHTGSKIAVQLAESRPDLVHRIALVSAPIYTEEELARQRESMGNPKPLFADGSHLVRDWNGLYEWRGPNRTLESVQREYAEQLRGGETRWYGHHAAFSYLHADHLPKVPVPVMVLCPNDDLVGPTSRAKDYITTGRFVDLPDWGHGMTETRTKDLAALLREFLDED